MLLSAGGGVTSQGRPVKIEFQPLPFLKLTGTTAIAAKDPDLAKFVQGWPELDKPWVNTWESSMEAKLILDLDPVTKERMDILIPVSLVFSAPDNYTRSWPFSSP